jgi:hypothetical protein
MMRSEEECVSFSVAFGWSYALKAFIYCSRCRFNIRH